MEHAKLNLRTENPGWNFESVKQTAQAKWKMALSKIEVTGGTEKHKRMLYSFLYHSLIHPNVFSDVNGDFKGFDQKIYNTGEIHALFDFFRMGRLSHPDAANRTSVSGDRLRYRAILR